VNRQQEQEMVLAQIGAWRAEGRKSFIRRDWDPALGMLQRSSSWLYNTMFPKLVAEGTLAAHRDGRLTSWEILAVPDGDEGQ
jgi:hypothetical protein